MLITKEDVQGCFKIQCSFPSEMRLSESFIGIGYQPCVILEDISRLKEVQAIDSDKFTALEGLVHIINRLWLSNLIVIL